MIRFITLRLGLLMARRRLARMVEANRNSFETRLYIKNRQAQIQRRNHGQQAN